MAQINSKQQWLDWIDEQAQSGLSVAAFCRSRAINVDNFYYHRGQQRKKSLAENAPFVRAQCVTEPAVTPNASVRLTLGDLTLYLPLDNPLHTAQLIKALQ
tara:strand:+ start:111 stop:413 length:303 start_codon:yes stop_codon:yes gene_type:complete